ncbi:MAG TPA: hypothetical protein VLB82_09960 [Thermodesulfobacteriota bacterium]|nr:hypothetical protein [Thermodesulfobacteriota bacterium]
MKHIVDINNYALFDYFPYLERGSECEKPKKLKYHVGQVVYLKHTNAIGVVLGCIDSVGEELRTDMDGMVCFDDLRPVKKGDFKIKDVRFIERLKLEVVDGKTVHYDKETRETTVID